MSVGQAFALAWKLRKLFVLSNLVFNILLTAFVAPIMALVVRGVLMLSGQPALADFDIAVFLMSPVGFLGFLLIAGLILTLQVLNNAFMMAIALRHRRTGETGFADGLVAVLPRVPAILQFGVLFALRVLVIALPFVLVSGALYLIFLTEFDINFYLSTKPPVFFAVVIACAVILGVGAVLLVSKLLNWAVALPLVIFSGISPRASFQESQTMMAGRRWSLLRKVVIWGVASSLALSALFAVVGFVADVSLGYFERDLRVLAEVLIVLALIWAVLNLIASAITTGALAVILIDKAGWPEAHIPAPSPKAMGRIRLTIGAATGICVVFAGLAILDFSRMTTPDQVEVIAHRGAAGARPENTMASIEKALDDGADWVEIDVQETADGEVIVIHDSDFMKIGGNPIKVWDATLADVQGIDVGSWFDPAYSDQRAPLLAEVLEASRGRAGVLIELKYYGHDEKLEQRVADIVADLGMDDEVMSMSLKYGAVQKMKGIRPDWRVGLLASASAGRIWELEADFLAVNKAAVSLRLVREMRAAGKKLYVWTVNEPLEMSRMVSMGVDGLITDEPALAHEVISQRHELSNAERLVLALANRIGVGLDTKETRDDSP